MQIPGLSYPNFVRGLSYANILIIASRIELLDTSCRAIRKVFRRFDIECEKYLSYPNFVQGHLLSICRPWLITLGHLNKHHCVIHKVSRRFGKKSAKNTKMRVYLAKWGVVLATGLIWAHPEDSREKVAFGRAGRQPPPLFSYK